MYTREYLQSQLFSKIFGFLFFEPTSLLHISGIRTISPFDP